MQKKLFWPIASLLICALLYFIWPTTHTIALRKLFLILGAVAGLVLLVRSENRHAILKSSWVKYLALLLAWVVFHAAFLSQNGAEAWGELLGQWLPPYLALVAGMGLGLASQSINPSVFRFYLIAVLAAPSVAYLLLTLVIRMKSGYFAIGYWGMSDHKMSLVFYADLLAALSCAKLVAAFKADAKSIKRYMWLLPVALALYVAKLSDSLNGILLLSVSVLLTVGMLVYHFRAKVSRTIVMTAVILSVAVSLYAVSVSSNITTRWQNLVSNTRVAVNIDAYPNWTNFSRLGLPKNEQGEQVPESSYLRIAYARAGFRTVLEHPWGYGVTRHAFERLVQQKYPDVAIANSHNGYIDLVCAVGFPALLLLALVLVSVFRQLRKSSSEWAHPAVWMLGIVALHWAIDPISRDHYFETYLFIIGLFATLTLNTSTQKLDAGKS